MIRKCQVARERKRPVTSRCFLATHAIATIRSLNGERGAEDLTKRLTCPDCNLVLRVDDDGAHFND
jgi:hypothetical protein